MGFFSAVKKFFGHKTEEPKETVKKEELNDRETEESTQLIEDSTQNKISYSEEDNESDSTLNSFEKQEETENLAILTPDIEPTEDNINAKQKADEIKEFDQIQQAPPIKGLEEGKSRPEGSPDALSSKKETYSYGEPIDATYPKENLEDEQLILALRNAEPKLSIWLDIILKDQKKVDENFWNRLKFLLNSLEAPPDEINVFISDFSRWLEKMEYLYIDEFRSELQYRLALALDLEDEEDERNRLFVKMEQGLAATRAQLGRQLELLLTSHKQMDDKFWEEMEELFITSDMGYDTSLEIVKRLKKRIQNSSIDNPAEVIKLLQEEFAEVFKKPIRIKAYNKPEVILMMGVNGAGKTTTIAKLAYRDRVNGKKVLIVAADTFRAAAMEQLKVWADRVGAHFYQKPAGADPASVAWEGMDYALKNNIDVVYIDTAGRLQTRVNLMEELAKIRQVVGKKHPGSPHRSILVLDATTGQNALSQAKLFKEGGGADEIILTKLDGTAKGGVAIAVAMRENLPISYIGMGEKMEDLRPFDGDSFASAILNPIQNAA